MNKIKAGLATGALAIATGVFAFASPAQALPAGCQIFARTPVYISAYLDASGGVAGCTAKNNISITVTLWRNNGNGTYSSWRKSASKNGVVELSASEDLFCSGISTAPYRVWHTETQATVNGVANTPKNSADMSGPCV
jgi:hypothetical protein